MSSSSRDHAPSITAVTSGQAIWECKVGVAQRANLPPGSDLPMRRAVERAFAELTGVEPSFNFSGWGAKLTEPERAVVENRLPTEEYYRETRLREAAPDLLEALRLSCDLIVEAAQGGSYSLSDYESIRAAIAMAEPAPSSAEPAEGDSSRDDDK